MVPAGAARVGLPLGSAQGYAFLGERKGASGDSLLVAVRYVVAGGADGGREVVVEAEVFRPAGLSPGSRLKSVASDGTVDHADSGTVTILAGQPDPTDPSRFKLAYDLGGRRRSLTGEVVDKGSGAGGMTCGNAVGVHVLFYRE